MLRGLAGLKVTAMVAGILTFVVIYVYIESRKSIRARMKSRPFRAAIYTGYITRIAISVLFPVGVYLDVICGVFSVSLTGAILGEELMIESRSEATELSVTRTLILFYITTLVQGVILNLILGAYTLVVYAIAVVFSSDTYQTTQLQPREEE